MYLWTQSAFTVADLASKVLPFEYLKLKFMISLMWFCKLQVAKHSMNAYKWLHSRPNVLNLTEFQFFRNQWSPSLMTMLSRFSLQRLRTGADVWRWAALLLTGWMYPPLTELSVMMAKTSGSCVGRCILTQRQTLICAGYILTFS